jgi:circadian clock protein KaiB
MSDGVPPIRLRLYVAGRSPRSLVALRNLERLSESALSGRYELEVVDVLADPARAEVDRILATPTLVKLSPGPQRRILGDLGDVEKLVKSLSGGDPVA